MKRDQKFIDLLLKNREIDPNGPTLADTIDLAQADANKYGNKLAVGWVINDDSGLKEYGYCPLVMVGDPAFVLEQLAVVSPQTKECPKRQVMPFTYRVFTAQGKLMFTGTEEGCQQYIAQQQGGKGRGWVIKPMAVEVEQAPTAEEAEALLGEKLAHELLVIQAIPDPPGVRWETATGDKTSFGLARTVRRIIAEHDAEQIQLKPAVPPMSGRTPFPWVIHEGLDYIVLMGPNDTTDQPIATIHRIEDAPLLGAAPAMLSALEAYDLAVQEVLDHWQEGDLAGAINALESLRDGEAAQAIAAANGEGA